MGQSVSGDGGGIAMLDISAEIGACENGFTLTWTVLTPRGDSTATRELSTSNLKPTDNPVTFEAVQRRNLFGRMELSDPLGGEPYIWARLTHETLGAIALVIGADGPCEMQAHDRALLQIGLAPAFSRCRAGNLPRRFEAVIPP